MKQWDKYAQENPEHFILTEKKTWDPKEFFLTGKKDAECFMNILSEILPSSVPRGRMCEIGCGIGRMSIHFSDYFEEVFAIDVSQVMIEKAHKLHKEKQNVHFVKNDGSHIPFQDQYFDFIFSFLVFQHIPQKSAVFSYLREIHRALKLDGLAMLQFDTRPMDIKYKFYNLFTNLVPDFLLPLNRRTGIRRYRIDATDLKQLWHTLGFEILDRRGCYTDEHVVVLKKQ